jgi:prophage regulatory protein
MREPDRIIRLKTVLARTGLSRSTIYRKIAEGTFPAQIKISVNGMGWHESDQPLDSRSSRMAPESRVR